MRKKSGRRKMFWGLFLDACGVFQNIYLWPGEKNDRNMCFRGRFVEGPKATKKEVLLGFLQCFIAFNRKAASVI